MKQPMRSIALSIVATAALEHPAIAGQPPDVVQSDIYGNTAMGGNALLNNGTGAQNTAAGDWTLTYNGSGYENAAFGYGALELNVSGVFNTAIGAGSLSYSTGSYNTGVGTAAIATIQGGDSNTAVGYNALGNGASITPTSGNNNTAVGANAMTGSATMNASNNTAIGENALTAISTGSGNIAVGYEAGYNVESGSHNIDIGNEGKSADTGVIRIGKQGTQKSTFISGIDSNVVTGAAVYVTSDGELGVLASSERYKTSIEPIESNSARLQRLRPVSFHLKANPAGSVQYGLIAEEVNKVYPELVIRDAQGTIQGVRYDELAPLLLNELQQQRQELALLKKSNESMQAALLELQAHREQLAMR